MIYPISIVQLAVLLCLTRCRDIVQPGTSPDVEDIIEANDPSPDGSFEAIARCIVNHGGEECACPQEIAAAVQAFLK